LDTLSEERSRIVDGHHDAELGSNHLLKNLRDNRDESRGGNQ